MNFFSKKEVKVLEQKPISKEAVEKSGLTYASDINLKGVRERLKILLDDINKSLGY